MTTLSVHITSGTTQLTATSEVPKALSNGAAEIHCRQLLELSRKTATDDYSFWYNGQCFLCTHGHTRLTHIPEKDVDWNKATNLVFGGSVSATG